MNKMTDINKALRADDLRDRFVLEGNLLTRRAQHEAKDALEAALIDINETRTSLYRAYLYLNTYLVRKEQQDYEVMLEELRLDEEAERNHKKRKKKVGPDGSVESGSAEGSAQAHEGEDKKEESGSDGAENSGEEGGDKAAEKLVKPSRLKEFIVKTKESIVKAKAFITFIASITRRWITTQFNGIAVYAGAFILASEPEWKKRSFSDRVAESRMRIFVEDMKSENIEMIMHDIREVMIQYSSLMDKVSDAMTHRKLLSTDEFYMLRELPFIGYYTSIEWKAKRPQKPFVKPLGHEGLSKLEEELDQLHKSSREMLFSHYQKFLDPSLLSQIFEFDNKHKDCLSDIRRLNQAAEQWTSQITFLSKKTIRSINELVSTKKSFL